MDVETQRLTGKVVADSALNQFGSVYSVESLLIWAIRVQRTLLPDCVVSLQ